MARAARLRVGILSSAYAPAPGGAANYCRLLANHLARSRGVQQVQVFTEKYPGEPIEDVGLDGKLALHRHFPWRGGREVKDWRSYLDYARQSLSLGRIDRWLPGDLEVLLVQAHLHYHPTLLDRGLKALRRKRKGRLRLILDVRDPLMSQARKGCTAVYDAIICCSENSLRHIRETLAVATPAQLIPVPIEPVHLSGAEIEQVCRSYGLLGESYLFSANGISLAKGVDISLRVTELLRQQGHDLTLVVVGRRRDWGDRFERAADAGLLRYLGAVPQRAVLALAARSALHLNHSPIEGLPRASLESMAVGARVLLPPNVPEFMRHAPHLVARSQDPAALAAQVLEILRAPGSACPYPVAGHYIEALVPDYLALFSGERTPGLLQEHT